MSGYQEPSAEEFETALSFHAQGSASLEVDGDGIDADIEGEVGLTTDPEIDFRVETEDLTVEGAYGHSDHDGGGDDDDPAAHDHPEGLDE